MQRPRPQDRQTKDEEQNRAVEVVKVEDRRDMAAERGRRVTAPVLGRRSVEEVVGRGLAHCQKPMKVLRTKKGHNNALHRSERR